MLQATHVAAQYGQTAFIYHIVAKWNADPDVPDNDGRSPLHWFVLFLMLPAILLVPIANMVLMGFNLLFLFSFYILPCRAAYKGFADSIRLLLFLDAYRGRQDKEGMH